MLESKLIALAASAMHEISVQRRQKVDWLFKIHKQCNGERGRKNVCVCTVQGLHLLLKVGTPFCQELILSGEIVTE